MALSFASRPCRLGWSSAGRGEELHHILASAEGLEHSVRLGRQPFPVNTHGEYMVLHGEDTQPTLEELDLQTQGFGGGRDGGCGSRAGQLHAVHQRQQDRVNQGDGPSLCDPVFHGRHTGVARQLHIHRHFHPPHIGADDDAHAEHHHLEQLQRGEEQQLVAREHARHRVSPRSGVKFVTPHARHRLRRHRLRSAPLLRRLLHLAAVDQQQARVEAGVAALLAGAGFVAVGAGAGFVAVGAGAA
eukprot:scaffold159513_cov22-Prasinocladus_malaysianus.AAC.2